MTNDCGQWTKICEKGGWCRVSTKLNKIQIRVVEIAGVLEKYVRGAMKEMKINHPMHSFIHSQLLIDLHLLLNQCWTALMEVLHTGLLMTFMLPTNKEQC
jgi:hypothetical protein